MTYSLSQGDCHGTAVLAADAAQADAAAQLIRGQGLLSAWILHRDRECPLVLSLASGDKVVTQHVIRTEVCCNGVAAPSLKPAPKPATAPAATTSVLRVAALVALSAPSFGSVHWHRPADLCRSGAALPPPLDKQGSIKDAWQFSKHERAADEIVQGLAGVATSSVEDLFKASGSQEVFIEPVGRQESTPTVTVSWHRAGPQETWKQLYRRASGTWPPPCHCYRGNPGPHLAAHRHSATVDG